MFDIGFSELLLVMLVALLLIGPDKLPGLARNAGRWVGKAQAMLRSVKADIDRELASEELKKSLTEKGGETRIPDLFPEMQQVAEEVRCNFHLDASGQVQKPAPPQAPRSPPDNTG